MIRLNQKTLVAVVYSLSMLMVFGNKANLGAYYAQQWEDEMEALLARAEPFVIILEGERLEEAKEEGKHRGIWLKQNKLRLGTVCRALITIEKNDLRRFAPKAQSAISEKAFGIPMIIATDQSEAMDAAKQKLSRA